MDGFFPEGLSRDIFHALKQCAEDTDLVGLEQLIQEAAQHVARAKDARMHYPFINIPLAEAILDRIVLINKIWNDLSENDRYWMKGMIRYFSSMRDEVHDFSSPIGFEDDVDVLNSCLKLAGLEQHLIDPEEFDEVE